ncbi:hypothetical protein A1QO_04075 [Vibrio genomosp. F10 str. ZF-129]|uniref:Uncharacterized protein n=1 Tax=Vibrio genomosp. F10 str. ZF-129 TaxID=1187848 RepID=A0A1E5BIL8_9VIBR|nr:hypothetical protein [Vibrio genomosp. F10]OEE37289.1 hypothetical protein A1QO_04075 [Vibrio genomosp. F10 str. ZF-129]
MKCYLISAHKSPRFYKPDGSLIEVELNYVEEKTYNCIDSMGRVITKTVGGSFRVTGGVWLVEDVCQSVKTLEEKGIYPFESRSELKEFAKTHKITRYKYIYCCL